MQVLEKGSFTVQRFLDLNPLITPVLIVGDLNLHHPWWNPLAQSSPLSKRLTGYLHAAQATLLIDHATIESQGGTFHRPNSRKTSVIDLAFSIGFRSLHWQDWSYLPGTGSDHEAVSLRAFLPAYQAARPLLPQFCTKRADWEKFRKRLEEVTVSLKTTINAAATRGDFECVAGSL
ncbi:Endonuclease/exonuclease/phosphatase [Apiospora phragmitis]|uniref:Endonuclease/exonuclease/phosphatase n=1 Tax=Apiospora phragmitis TaxID=2905665 RepID=A0ABR1W5C0_9PEZI